jgi:hypothetical protein
MNTFSVAKLTIGSFVLDCYKSESEKYYLNQTQIAETVNKNRSVASKFFNSEKYTSGLQYFDPEKSTTVVLRSLKETYDFFLFQVFKKNNKALLLVALLGEEALTLRAEKAFGTLTSEKVLNIQEQTDDAFITTLRMNAKAHHNIFQRACYGSKMNPSLVHDRITKLVFGYTAKEARDLPMIDLPDDVWLNEAIGINHEHTKDPVLMQQYRDMKTKIFSYRKEKTWEEKVDRAYREVVELI